MSPSFMPAASDDDVSKLTWITNVSASNNAFRAAFNKSVRRAFENSCNLVSPLKRLESIKPALKPASFVSVAKMPAIFLMNL